MKFRYWYYRIFGKRKLKYVSDMSPAAWVRYYWPNASPDFVDFILWEKTCYPFSTFHTLEMLYELYCTGPDA